MNPELTVIAIGGDGDGYAEGGNHFLHAVRRNHSITYLVCDNQVYGLTKGQASPTSDPGFVTKTTPWGAPNPIHPLTFAIVGGASFVARGFSADVTHLTELIKQGITRKGFSLIDMLQPCVSFNFRNTYEWYRKRVYRLEEEKGYDPTNFEMALKKAQEWGERIPIGVIYKSDNPAFEEQLPVKSKGPFTEDKVEIARIERLLNEFAQIDLNPTG